jgi:16S rRNA (guanine966-N2)-methyltransferase
LRIVAGDWRGRKLIVPRGLDIRPTQERVREALFSRLINWVQEAEVVDLFAGSGALGFEALSRGARHCTFVENGRPALKALETNLNQLGAGGKSRIIKRDVFDLLERGKAKIENVGLLFADPPYGDLAAKVAVSLMDSAAISWNRHAVRVIECALDDPDWPVPPGWQRWDDRSYGKTRIVIEEKEQTEEG